MTQGMRAALSESLREWPELRTLVDLHKAGWTFLHRREAGELVQIDGIRSRPGGWSDAVRVRYVTDAAGLRADHTGRVVWRVDGTLVEVVDALLALPAPGFESTDPPEAQ